MKPLNLLYNYFTKVSPNPAILRLCGTPDADTPYTSPRDDDLTVIINAWARPGYLPLIWEAIQFQTRRPRETWIIQNNPGPRASVPRAFLESVSSGYDTVVIDSGMNHGCWFRFILAAIECRTRYVAIYDDDTLSGNRVLEGALDEMLLRPGVYGGRGVTLRYDAAGPTFTNYRVSGWPVGTELAKQVDFVGHVWVMETFWLTDFLLHLPDIYLNSDERHSECGEDMYVSFLAQRRNIPTFTLGHESRTWTPRWSSLLGTKMGVHPNAMFLSGGLKNGDKYLKYFLDKGWKLLEYGQDEASVL